MKILKSDDLYRNLKIYYFCRTISYPIYHISGYPCNHINRIVFHYAKESRRLRQKGLL